MYRNDLQKRLRFEHLEEKRALAADLSVAVVNGDLIITGDAEVNAFSLRDDVAFAEGEYEIGNLGSFFDTINGQPFTEYLVTGVTGDVIINLGGGDDVVYVYDAVFPSDMIVHGGDDNDQIYMGIPQNPLFVFQLPNEVAGDLFVSGDVGDDIIQTTALSVGDDYTVVDTQGNNEISMITGAVYVAGERSFVGDDLTIVTGAGQDSVGIEDTVVAGSVSISVGAGDDFAAVSVSEVSGMIFANLGSGTNEGVFESTDAGNALSVVGSGTNNILVQGVTSSQFITVVTASGNDIVQILESSTSSAVIATNGGSDDVLILDSAFALLVVELGQGNDTLTLGGVEVSLVALLSGGRGSDTLVDLGGNDINWELDLGFEIF